MARFKNEKQKIVPYKILNIVGNICITSHMHFISYLIISFKQARTNQNQPDDVGKILQASA